VKILSWSFKPPYRLTGGSETVAKDREGRASRDEEAREGVRAGRGRRTADGRGNDAIVGFGNIVDRLRKYCYERDR